MTLDTLYLSLFKRKVRKDRLLVIDNNNKFDRKGIKYLFNENLKGRKQKRSYRQNRFPDSLAGKFNAIRNQNMHLRDSLRMSLVKKMGKEGFLNMKDDYTNKKLLEILLNEFNPEKTIEISDKIIQRYEPVYMRPGAKNGREQFYTPWKQVGNTRISTLWFNVIVLWTGSLLLYITVYYKLLQKAVNLNFPSRVKKAQKLSP